jgi:two-component system sensor histidine kinase YesM
MLTNVKTSWKIINIIEASELFQDAEFIRKITIFIFSILLMSGLFLAFWFGNSITRGLKRLSILMKVNTNFVITKANQFDKNDEVGQMGHRFIRMMEENRKLNNQIIDALLKRKEAEIQALQAQIKPHFLYNTLESLNWLAISRNQFEISEVVGSLGKFFRIAISKGKEMIEVSEELDHVTSYVKVQQFRYKDKFDFFIELDPKYMPCFLPKFILQPIVENAIYHGIKLKKESGTIMVSGGPCEEGLLFQITDDGLGMSSDRLESITQSLNNGSSGEIYGLKNVHERLRMRFGENYGLEIKSEIGKYTTVNVKVPLITNYEEAPDDYKSYGRG